MLVGSDPCHRRNKVKRLAVIKPIVIKGNEDAAFEDRSPHRLKILFLTNRSPYPITDGQSRRTYNILKGLARRHDVSLLSLYESPKEIEPNSIHHLKEFCERVEMLLAPPKTVSIGMATRLLMSIFSPEPYTIWRHYSQEYVDRVWACLKSTTFDVVHCDALPLAYVMRGLRAPVRALTDHDVSYVKAERLAQQRRNVAVKCFISYEAMKLKRLERRIFRHVDIGIAVSECDSQVLQALCPEGRFAVVENGVDTKAFTPNSDAVESDTLLWVGGFQHYPNYEAVRYLIEDIYPVIKRAKPQVKLYIVGGSVPASLMRLAVNDTSILFTGFVDDPVPFIQRAAVFVAPILSGGGTKLKVLEAMAAGKAIVSTSIGVEGIEGEDCEHFMVADTPEVFSLRVVSLMNDYALRARLGANARKRSVEKYDWEAICDSISKVYQDARRNVC